MKDIYNYNENITIIKTINGDAVVTMNESILITITGAVSAAMIFQQEEGYKATADDTYKLLQALINKSKEAGLR